MEFLATVKNGKADVHEKAGMAEYIKGFKDETEVKITITKVVISRSVEQNSGLHLLLTWFTKFLNETTGQDMSVEKVKNMLKAKRNWTDPIVDLKTGEYLGEELRSFSKLTLPEASDWITWIYSYAATEWEFTLPILEKRK